MKNEKEPRAYFEGLKNIKVLKQSFRFLENPFLVDVIENGRPVLTYFNEYIRFRNLTLRS